MDEFTIIDPDDPETLPDATDRYAVVYRQGGRVARYVERYLASEQRWLTGMPDVEILAWSPLPDIPKEITELEVAP